MENLQLSLVLQTENKGSVVAGGELNVCLDGLVVDLGSLPNGSTATDSESRLTTHILTHTHTHVNTYKKVHTILNANKMLPHTLSLFLAFSLSLGLWYIFTLITFSDMFVVTYICSFSDSTQTKSGAHLEKAKEFLL